MSRKRVILLTPVPFWNIGTYEFIEELEKNNFLVCALDIWSFHFYDDKGNQHKLYPQFLKGAFLKAYIKLNRKRILKKYIKKTDVVDIQWCGHYYAKYMDTIKQQSEKVVATLFGSDIYRNTDEEKLIQQKIFETADKILMGPNMDSYFLEHFPQFKEKVVFGQYGSKRLTIVDDLNSLENKREFREKYKIDQNKLVVTVGYNAKEQQQHLLFLKDLKTLTKEEKDKLFLLIPLTYGRKDNYIHKLKIELESLEIDYLCIEKSIETGERWLTNNELAELRIISDITVNIQTTDALASSIKEAFVAGDIVITGDWLPYQIYQDMGAFMIRTNLEELFENFKTVIDDYSYYQKQTKKNREIILNFSSWNKVIKFFINNYSDERS